MAHVRRRLASFKEYSVADPAAPSPRLFCVEGKGGGGGLLHRHFLDACCLCGMRLAGNRDIFMYRGDSPFCSEESRSEQIKMDAAAVESRCSTGAWGRRKTGSKARSASRDAEDGCPVYSNVAG